MRDKEEKKARAAAQRERKRERQAADKERKKEQQSAERERKRERLAADKAGKKEQKAADRESKRAKAAAEKEKRASARKKKREEREAERQSKRSGSLPTYFDYPLMVTVILLLAFGLVMLYSASYYNAVKSGFDNLYFFMRQLWFALGSIAMMILLPAVSYRRLFPLAVAFYVGAIAAMAMVHVPRLGIESHGAYRWLKLGPITFQPSELGKVAVIIFLPMLILRLGKKLRKLRYIFLLFLAVGVQAAACMILTDNLSTAIIIFFIGYIIIFIAYPYSKRFILITLGGAAAVAALLPEIFRRMEGSFRLTRIQVWLAPAEHLNEGGWQVMQALYAIGSGGIFGKGLGNSTQKLGWIPEAQNDMIFSIVCEELGLFGAVILLGLFVYLIYRLVFVAQNAPDVYGSLMVTGVAAHITIQVVLNISVVLNIIPTTGVTLPLVSYGGTALLIQVFEICIALSVSRRIRLEDAQEMPVFPRRRRRRGEPGSEEDPQKMQIPPGARGRRGEPEFEEDPQKMQIPPGARGRRGEPGSEEDPQKMQIPRRERGRRGASVPAEDGQEI